MRLDVRATAPLNARNEKITLTFEAGEVINVEMTAPASTPVTWITVDPLQIELTGCNAFEFVLNLKDGGTPRIRVRIQTGSGCDVALMLDGANFAHVGPNLDQTFTQNC